MPLFIAFTTPKRKFCQFNNFVSFSRPVRERAPYNNGNEQNITLTCHYSYFFIASSMRFVVVMLPVFFFYSFFFFFICWFRLTLYVNSSEISFHLRSRKLYPIILFMPMILWTKNISFPLLFFFFFFSSFRSLVLLFAFSYFVHFWTIMSERKCSRVEKKTHRKIEICNQIHFQWEKINRTEPSHSS